MSTTDQTNGFKFIGKLFYDSISVYELVDDNLFKFIYVAVHQIYIQMYL